MNPLRKFIHFVGKATFSFGRVRLTDEFKHALDILEHSQEHLFITGKAGTGKTTLIQYFRSHTAKKVVVVAPTGIAAINIQGATIHAFFKFPPRFMTPDQVKKTSNNRIYLEMDLLVIDEISMVRADVLDNIDRFLRINGRDRSLPFGGTRVILVGDLYQLPPVLTMEESGVYGQLYETRYFFGSRVFASTPFRRIELREIFRQKEARYVEVLNKIRVGDVSLETLSVINDRVTANPKSDHIILCAVNRVAESINVHRLASLASEEYTFQATIEGDFPTEDRYLPVELELRLKKGARVLFVRNDKGGAWVNGTLGTVHHLDAEQVHVKLDTGTIVEVERDFWENIRYALDESTGKIEANVLGTLTQYPLKLAWAITIHKSQGMSFDKVTIDFTRSPFEHGQTYVALSRCRTLNGLQLTRKIYPNDVLIDDKIIEFYNYVKN